MTVQGFFDRAIDWLRSEHHLRTDVLAGSHLEDTTGHARLDGYFSRSSAPRKWGLAGLWIVTFGTIVAMMNLPGWSPTTRVSFERMGIAIVVTGALCWVVAEVLRRRHRTRAFVELRAGSAEAATAETIEALHAAAHGAEAWCVTEAPLDPDAAAAAKKRGVRCFLLRGSRFEEAKA